jgi:predicted permease
MTTTEDTEDSERRMRPPRVAERILRACLPRGVKGLAMLGDLREEYYVRVRGPGGPRYVRNGFWFWREALLLSLRYMNIANDVRLAFRSLHRHAATSAIIIVTLGSAMAASTIGFSVADLALLRGLPVDDGDRVVMVHGIDPRTSTARARLSPANFRDLKSRVTTLSHFAAFQNASATIVDRGIPASLDATHVGADFFAAMGQKPYLGRLYQRGDDEPGRSDLVVLAHQYWSRVFGADQSLVGRSLFIDGRDRVVIGIAAPEIEFADLANVDVWLPLEIPADASRTERVLRTMARLGDGVTIEQARAEVAAISNALALEFPDENSGWQASVVPVADAAFGRGFWVVIALFVTAVTLVIVIACANAASLVLAGAMARRREIAVRSALGAGRWRLLRQALVEGVVLSLGSVALAVPCAELGLRAIRSLDSDPVFRQLHLDWHELGLLGIVALAAPILFSVVPTMAAIRLDLRTALQSGGMRIASGAGRSRAVLVAMQLSLAVTLLIAAGLALRTVMNLSEIDVGIRTAGALTFGIDLSAFAKASADKDVLAPIERPRALVDEARRRLQTVAGVVSVHAFEALPVIANERLASIAIDDRPLTPGEAAPWAIVNGATPSALEAMDVPVVAGRWLLEQDEHQGIGKVLVGRKAAEMYFGSVESAVGKTFTLAAPSGDRQVEIAGVVADVLTRDLERGAVPRVWTGLQDVRHVTVVVVTHGDPAALSGQVRREMAALAPMMPLEHLDTFDAHLTRYRSSNLVTVGIFAGFAGLALLLAAAGLYGLITYTVAQRVGEFGTRLALGARPRDVLLLVIRQVVRLVGIGLAIGLLAGVAAGHGMRSVLYGVSSTDPVTIVAVTGLMALVALVASIRPAVRAARINLADALRAE